MTMKYQTIFRGICRKTVCDNENTMNLSHTWKYIAKITTFLSDC